MSFLKEKFSNAINNDKGLFQGGEFVGFKNIANKFKDKPYAGIPGVCPYTGKPLQTPTEQQTGVSDDIAQAQQTGINPNTGRDVQFAPTTGKFGSLNQALMRGGMQ